MADTPENIEDFSPYKLLDNFSKSRVLPCLFLALLLHVLVVGGTSYNFIYYTWINPAAKPAEATIAEGTDESSETPSETPASEQKSAEGTAVEKAPAEGKPGAEKDGGAETPEKPGEDEPPVIKAITEKPKPGETPAEPGGLGISIEETNR